MSVVRHGKNVLDRLRQILFVKAPAADNIIPLDSQQVRDDVASISDVMGFPVPNVRMISNTGLLIERA